MKILVCGGRDYRKVVRLCNKLKELNPTFIVSGGQTGADSFAIAWAMGRGCGLDILYADWDTHGNAAGPIRNGEMLKKHPDIELVVCCKGDKGTANMRKQAKEKNIRILEVE